MALSTWFCANNTRNMLLQIVHPGGHVELHDRPVLAAEIMVRNPRYCIAHPNVFQQPRAIVGPQTRLTLGQKFYLVPMSTIRKLQRLSSKYSPSPFVDINSTQTCSDEKIHGITSSCCLFVNKNTPKPPRSYLKPLDKMEEKHPTGSNNRKFQKDAGLGGDNCFKCLLTRIKISANSDDSSLEARPSSAGLSVSTENPRKRSKEFINKEERGWSPRRRTSLDQWQPSLESIKEE